MVDQGEWHGWHLDKRVSIGHVITTLTVAATLLVFGLRLEGRISLNEHRIVQTEQHLQELRETQSINQAEIIRRLERISDKLDTKQDR